MNHLSSDIFFFIYGNIYVDQIKIIYIKEVIKPNDILNHVFCGLLESKIGETLSYLNEQMLPLRMLIHFRSI